ncbi:MAG: helix-turn-helix domain-containing protein [Rhodothermaceae bacterium]
MKTLIDILLVFSSVGIVNSIFFIIYFNLNKERRSQENILFLLLLLAFVIRIGKSVFLYFTGGLSDIVINIGFTGFTSIGPFFYLYLKTATIPDYKVKKRDYLHFIIPTAILLFSPLIPYQPRSIYWFSFYMGMLTQIFLYLSFSLPVLVRFIKADKSVKKHFPQNRKKWLLALYSGLFIIWFCYFINIIGIGSYINGAIAYTFVFYTLMYLEIHPQIKQDSKSGKYNNINLTETEIEKYSAEVNLFIKESEIYKREDLTLPLFAKESGIPAHTISFVINKKLNRNFSDFVNYYRIENVKLQMQTKPEEKIATLAFEAGFKSISAFNNSFKKFSGITPTQYKELNFS